MNNQTSKVSPFLLHLKKGLWFLCLPAWMFGSIERSINTFMDGIASALEITQVFTTFFFLVCWVFLRPISKI